MYNKVYFYLILMVRLVVSVQSRLFVSVKNLGLFSVKNIDLGLYQEQEDELFGKGLGQEVQPVSFTFFIILWFFGLLCFIYLQEIEYSKHLSSSMEDLLKLFHNEQILLKNSTLLFNLTEAEPFLKQINHRYVNQLHFPPSFWITNFYDLDLKLAVKK